MTETIFHEVTVWPYELRSIGEGKRDYIIREKADNIKVGEMLLLKSTSPEGTLTFFEGLTVVVKSIKTVGNSSANPLVLIEIAPITTKTEKK